MNERCAKFKMGRVLHLLLEMTILANKLMLEAKQQLLFHSTTSKQLRTFIRYAVHQR